MADRVEAFLAMLARGQDSALLRFSLGNEYLARDEAAAAAEQLHAAVAQDRNYSAAWKLLGKALAAQNLVAEACEAWRSGIAAAEARGDRQAAKEMAVFVKRAERGQ